MLATRFSEIEHEIAFECLMRRIEWLRSKDDALETIDKILHEFAILEALSRRIKYRAPAMKAYHAIDSLLLECV